MLFFLLAGAYKITALISLAVIICIYFLEITGITKFEKSKIFIKPIFNAIPFVIISIIIGSWVYFAKYYNAFHGSGYFSTGIFPLWDLDETKIQMVTDNIRKIWLNQYFHVCALYFFAAIFLVSMSYFKKANRFLIAINILLFVGTVLYSILWFWTFRDHDYYTINLYILLIFTMLNFIWWLKDRFSKVYASKYVKILFVAFLLFNMNHARNQVKKRYYGWWSEYPEYKDYHVVTPYLRSIGIAPLDTVVCLPDVSHFTLYLMNQRGWTECMGYNTDSTLLASSVKNGAKYLIINGDEVIKRKYLQSFLSRPIGQFNSIRIFKLK